MQLLLEHWRKYLVEEENVLDEDEVYLYHVSSVPDIEILDPKIAAKNPKLYTRREYKEWDRPRVFFFTTWGQEDTGLGRIGGGTVYRVKLKQGDLYPIYEDPLKLSHPDDPNSRHLKRKYKRYADIADSDMGGLYNTFERVATLAQKLHGYLPTERKS